MKPIKTVVAACLAAVALSVGALSLGACGPSAEEVVRQGVADELERLKTHDEALLNELAADSGVDQLATYGIDYFQLGYMTGQQAVKILTEGASPADMPIEYLPAEKCELTVNEETAQTLGIDVSGAR